MAAIRTALDSDRVMTVWLDLPGKPVNTCAPALLDELSSVLDGIENDPPAGVIIASAKNRSFNAGADLTEVKVMSPADLADYLKRGQALFDRIATLPIPTVAAINGDCLGGGFELALACWRRVAADDATISIGLPEVKLGLIPAWGGTTRLPRLIGLRKALPILLAGKTMPPRKAMKNGLVDEVVRPEALLAAAKRLTKEPRPLSRLGFVDRSVAKVGLLRQKALNSARQQTLAKTYGNYPAPTRLLDVIAAGYDLGVETGLREEQKAITELVAGAPSQNLLRVFFLRQGAKKRLAKQIIAPPHEVHHAAVVGGGTMGAGIAHALIRAGVQVRLVEVDPKAVSAALKRIKGMLDDDVAMGKLDKLGARHAMNHVSPTTDWTGLRLADIVIEAAFEKLEAKHEVFRKLEQLCRPDAILATNTSSLRVARIAQAVKDPGRVVGLHFFNPVPKMPLVEVVRTNTTRDDVLSTAATLASRLGKTPILVGDGPGFLVNRLLIPYLAEALAVAAEGVPITGIDLAMKRWGMPMGPFELLDEIGLDVAASVLKALGDGAVPDLVNRAIASGWLGRKTGRGFYVHPTGKAAASAVAVVNSELMTDEDEDRGLPAYAEMRLEWRLLLPMISQAAGALREGIVDSAETIDLAMVMGTGLAPFRGGLAHFADQTGLPEIVRLADEMATQIGPRFTPDVLLRDMAMAGSTFADWQINRATTSPSPGVPGEG